jgi:hypothetical protein
LILWASDTALDLPDSNLTHLIGKLILLVSH